MLDLRNYKELIRELVARENSNDPNWKWSVKSISKTKVLIRWGYLDYMEEKNNCFVLELENDVDGTGIGDWIHARRPDGEIIEAYLVVEGKPNPKLGAEQNIRSGLRDAIEEIAYIAHSRY